MFVSRLHHDAQDMCTALETRPILNLPRFDALPRRAIMTLCTDGPHSFIFFAFPQFDAGQGGFQETSSPLRGGSPRFEPGSL